MKIYFLKLCRRGISYKFLTIYNFRQHLGFMESKTRKGKSTLAILNADFSLSTYQKRMPFVIYIIIKTSYSFVKLFNKSICFLQLYAFIKRYIRYRRLKYHLNLRNGNEKLYLQGDLFVVLIKYAINTIFCNLF